MRSSNSDSQYLKTYGRISTRLQTSSILKVDLLGIDFISQFIGSDRLYEEKYLSDVSDEYKAIIEAYCEGINRFAELHPQQVLSKKLFPINTKSLFLYGQLQLFISSKGDYWVKKILKNKINYNPVNDRVKGSNTFAFNSSKTKDGNTYLAINTHQPLDGPTSCSYWS